VVDQGRPSSIQTAVNEILPFMEQPRFALKFIDSENNFTVSRIICIGRNYAEHAREMGHNPEREQPFFFFKPLTALLPPGKNFIYPWYSNEVHHELELVIALGAGGSQVTSQDASQLIAGFGIGLDMTCRDIQQQAKKQGRPWELAKGFDGSAPCSELMAGSYDDLQKMGRLSLLRNDVVVQEGNWREMVWSVPELLAEISRYINLCSGDLIFTGTPAGVGAVLPGDCLVAKMEGFPLVLEVQVAAAGKTA
jgi:fumarylpyruvate hydrolase